MTTKILATKIVEGIFLSAGTLEDLRDNTGNALAWHPFEYWSNEDLLNAMEDQIGWVEDMITTNTKK